MIFIMVKYKQRCGRCKKNYTLSLRSQAFIMCAECHAPFLAKEIEDPSMKEFFDIGAEYYDKDAYLRTVKMNYLKYGNITDYQRKQFLRVIEIIDQDE